ncbi:MAG: ribonuclease HII, partial [Microgenomates group bacterium LiPW_31]
MKLFDIIILDMKPNLSEEKKLWKKGYKRVACIDEVGRGALCGPVVAVAVTIIKKSPFQKLWKSDLHNIKDSKKLTPKKREEFYKLLRNHPAIEWGLGSVSEKVIDRINILEATKLAMERAIENLEKKYSHADHLVLDGKIKLD